MKHTSPATRPFILGLGAGVMIGLVLVLVLLRWLWADPTPQLSFDDYLHALKRWNDEAPMNYDVEVEVRGSQPASYFVQVRDGEPQSAFRNGNFLPHHRSHGTWSVDGMFATLAEDVGRMQAAERDRQGLPFTLRVKFDPQYGFPSQYRRSEHSSPVQVQWDVRQFKPLAAGVSWSETFPDQSTEQTAPEKPQL